MTVTYDSASQRQSDDVRAVWPAIKKGLRTRCPKCGTGSLFNGFLKVNDTCGHCGEELHHHRADDFPPYVTMVIVGHIIVFAMLHMEMAYEVQPMVYLWTMVPAAIILSTLMMRPVKGAIVGLQWANRMHGFAKEPVGPDGI
jgi:uncharacterized protein (DUF983 family)